MSSHRLAGLVAIGLLIAGTASALPAAAPAVGSNLLGVQLTDGMADLYGYSGSNLISAYDHSELGVGLQLWHFMTSDYAMAFSAGYGFFSETDQPGNNAPAGMPDFKYTQSSYSVRVGGDRVLNLGSATRIYLGPGVEYWSGKAKFDTGVASTTFETQDVTRLSLSSRLGAMMKLNENLSFSCQVGHKLGHATASDKGRKATWWPSSFDGACGLVFALGGH